MSTPPNAGRDKIRRALAHIFAKPPQAPDGALQITAPRDPDRPQAQQERQQELDYYQRRGRRPPRLKGSEQG